MNVDLKENLADVQHRMEKAARKAGRNAGDITLVAVTKTVGVDRIREITSLGINVLGENRVQELMDKVPCLPGDIQWHMIGHLQRNKVKYIIDKVAMIQSLDRWSLAEEIEKRARWKNVIVPVLVEVNVAGEDTKYGLAVNEVLDFLSEVSRLNNIQVRGLMTVAPFVDDPEEVRPVFKEMRNLAKKISGNLKGVQMDFLSMGMTNDFEVAIEEGANMVRVGSALFGPRTY